MANLPANAPTVLTVVVVDSKSQPVSGANVSITPSNQSATTNSSGEVQFTLGTATKYNVTASADGKTVTVPYYVTANGATRLVVNPVYVEKIEQQLNPSPWYDSGIVVGIGITLLVLVALFILMRLYFRFIWKSRIR